MYNIETNSCVCVCLRARGYAHEKSAENEFTILKNSNFILLLIIKIYPD